MLRYRAAANAAANAAAAAAINPVSDGEAMKMGAAAGGMSMEGCSAELCFGTREYARLVY